jgi:DNA-binding transcriptional LysR family regulator
MRPSQAIAGIERGELDVAFLYERLSADGVTIESIGSLTMAVYCGKRHPLFRVANVARADLLEHAFSVPPVGDSGQVLDGWPSTLPRKIGMRITLLRSNLEVCRSGALLTVLPDITALPSLRRGELRRIPLRDLPIIEIFAARHGRDAARGPHGLLIEAIRHRVADTNHRVRAALRSPVR